jgi:hypothetical protein
MPASESLLCLFIAYYGAGQVAEGTIASWLSGLEMWHSINTAPWQGGRILRRTKHGIAKLAPASCRKPPRDPVTKAHMEALREHLDLSNTCDAAIWAAACIAWCGVTRSVIPLTLTTYRNLII